MVGKTIVRIDGLAEGSKLVTFHCLDGSAFRMLHDQECCESVELVDVDEPASIGDGLVRSASMATFDASSVGKNDSETWTFYKIAIGWSVLCLRWCGSSNGCYSEKVSFEQREGPTP
jgi:hypothetical protein